MRRRDFLVGGLAGSVYGQAPAYIPRRPQFEGGIQCGDVTPGRAIIWCRADRPSRMIVSWSTSEKGERHTLPAAYCIESTDFTARAGLDRLPPGQTIRYQVQLEGLADSNLSEPLQGMFRTPPASGSVRFLWSGDTVGQGWGIDVDRGGMRIYETMRRREPHFFIHSGDTIYADNPLQESVKLPDGTLWKNIVIPEKSKVAETLDEYRGNYRYNLLDENVRRFSAEVAQIWQWDDHEVMNNWSSAKDIREDVRYREKNVMLLAARAQRAFLEYAPMRFSSDEPARVYRRIAYGPNLDVFVIDLRTYRGPNTFNRETEAAIFLGRPQLEWLMEGLRSSKATWKAIACDMPIGLLVGDGKDEQGRDRFEAFANGDGPPLGRELELAGLLRFIKQRDIRNVVWFTADVHYTAAHYYDPAKARFTDFAPFWEFVSGPLHAGTFGPGKTDDTFGIQVMYQKHPPQGQSNLPPSAGMQFFGEVEIDGARRAMAVTLRDTAGTALFRKVLEAR
jgi:alkaline phosphatase D